MERVIEIGGVVEEKLNRVILGCNALLGVGDIRHPVFTSHLHRH